MAASSPRNPACATPCCASRSGPVAAFSPWNFPMSSPSRKVGGALSAGCSIILKASEETPAGAVQLARAFTEAGLPPGVLNLVFGEPSKISDYLIPHPSMRLVTFTGSIPVGKHLAAMAGQHMKPAIMELGGHAPVIVCDDVDPVATATTSVTASRATPARCACRRRAGSCRTRSMASSPRPLPRRQRPSRSATAWTPTTRWVRSPTAAAST